MKHDKKIVKDFFGKCVKRYGDNVHSLAWESEYTQNARFSVLSGIADLNGMSILDVGCGKADLYSFLLENGVTGVEYYGVDMTLGLLDIAKKNFPDISLYYRDFLIEARYPEVDYVMSSGLANVKTPNNQQYMEEAIKKMFRMCRAGTAVNMLSSYAIDSQMENGMYFYSPEQMFRFAMKLTQDVVLRHDYLANDFTLYLHKKR
ncbi:MAG: class I SAM-dependent methyltransferase [bacterium]|nr:class I SAM-dependent methyltransferase [bacterium]